MVWCLQFSSCKLEISFEICLRNSEQLYSSESSSRPDEEFDDQPYLEQENCSASIWIWYYLFNREYIISSRWYEEPGLQLSSDMPYEPGKITYLYWIFTNGVEKLSLEIKREIETNELWKVEFIFEVFLILPNQIIIFLKENGINVDVWRKLVKISICKQ